MITLVLEAKNIPNGTSVRKVTGSVEYILNRELSIHLPGETRKIKTEGIVFLTSESNINGYPDTTKFAIDLSPEEAIELIEEISGD